MAIGFHSLDPSGMPLSQIYDVLVAGIQPRPIAYISTMSAGGEPNLAPFSFFMAGGANPPSLVYSPTLNKEGGKKHSLINVEETGEFVVNTVTRAMAESMQTYSLDYPDRTNEWEMSGLTAMASEAVRPARVAQSPVHFECKLFQVVQHGNSPFAACYVVGQVVRIHVSDSVWDGQSIDPLKFRPICRMGGQHYLDTESLQLFSLGDSMGGPGSS